MLTKENDKIFTDSRLIALQEYFTRREEIEMEAKIRSAENEQQRQLLIEQYQNEGINRRISNAVAAAEQLKNVEIDANKIIQQDNEELLRNKQRQRQQDVNNLSKTGDLIDAIAGEQTKAGFLISKAAALAQVIINTITASTAALAPPPLGLGPVAGAPLAASIKLGGAISAATIAAQAITGFENGGIVGGTSFTGDQVQARVNSGEMILNRQQQSQLFKMANGQGGGDSAKEITINTTVELDSEVVGRATSLWVANGGQLGEVQ